MPVKRTSTETAGVKYDYITLDLSPMDTSSSAELTTRVSKKNKVNLLLEGVMYALTARV